MLSRQLSIRPLPATPVPIVFCGPNRRFVLRCFRIEQSFKKPQGARGRHSKASRLTDADADASDQRRTLLDRFWMPFEYGRATFDRYSIESQTKKVRKVFKPIKSEETAIDEQLKKIKQIVTEADSDPLGVELSIRVNRRAFFLVDV